jgi:hypothetical protein
MSLTRRDMLVAAVGAGTVTMAGGCEKLISRVTSHFGQNVPEHIAVPSSNQIDPAHHLASRAGYGPWPGDVEMIRSTGQDKWIEQQLDPETINDKLCDLRARRFWELEQGAGECYEYDKPVLREEMARHTLLRAVYSKRQLFEVMVGFWTDHLNINIEKGDCIYLKPEDDREVVRKHALGKFGDIIRASATSAAMLVYLDGNQNTRAKPTDIPNENYGRELLELHTLGVHGGYTQRDVSEAARALTGWKVRTRFRHGTVYFDPKLHDQGGKRLLGQAIAPGEGEKDVDRVVDIVCNHPATARHIARKLAVRFVADDPPEALVNRVAAVFRATDGDIKATVRAVLTSDEFKVSRGTKFKPPFRFVASALRAMGADTHAHSPLIEYLVRMGEGVFQYPAPDGYPDKASPWLGTLMWRWNFAFALTAGQVPTVNVDSGRLTTALGAGDGNAGSTMFRYFTGRKPRPDEIEALASAQSLPAPSAQAGLLLASPQFQMY